MAVSIMTYHSNSVYINQRFINTHLPHCQRCQWFSLWGLYVGLHDGLGLWYWYIIPKSAGDSRVVYIWHGHHWFIINDPSVWPAITYFRVISYFEVASLAVVVYDIALTFGQELELVWRQRWSLMTWLYLIVRYMGIPFAIILMLPTLPSVSLTDAGCTVIAVIADWSSFLVNAMLCVIVIARLHAMYQQSRKMLIFLVVTFMATRIADAVVTVIKDRYTSGVEYVLSGAHLCSYNPPTSLIDASWVSAGAIWEILVLCLAVWIAVKHFRELQRPSTGWTVGDCFAILLKTHMFYFASFVAVSCLTLGILFTPIHNNPYSVGAQIYSGILQIIKVVQIFVLGPRLILRVREYHANLVANSDGGTGMTSIAFQKRIHITTGGGV